MSDCLQLEVEGAIATLTLHRPEAYNSINADMREALRARFREIEMNRKVRVVILTGSGKAFCSGADLKEGMAGSVQDALHHSYLPAVQPIRELDQVIITAVNGVTAGIGCTLVTASDLSVMSETATMNLAFSRIALIPDGGLTWDLVRAIGYKRAYKLMIEGGTLSAQQCLDYGIVNELTPADQVMARARALAEQVAEYSPIANKLTKRALRRALDLALQPAIDYESSLQERAASSADSQEGVAAFLEKRKPCFTGE